VREKIIDIHIHIGGQGDDMDDVQSGCEWSSEFEETLAFKTFMMTLGLTKKTGTQSRITRKILKKINKSKIDYGVLLALDNVYDEHGFKYDVYGNKYDDKGNKVGSNENFKSHLVVPNKYVSQLSKDANNKKILFGCSVHPYRKDIKNELKYCAENGAVLCKWIPSSQMIDPSNPICNKTYELLAEKNIPLLIHNGPEPSVPTSYKKEKYKFNWPKYLEYPLKKGVIVIVAHCAVPYFGILDANTNKLIDELVKMFDKAEKNKWKLYADVSALCSFLQKESTIKRIINEINPENLLLGSDFPVPISPLSYSKVKPSIIELIVMHFKNPISLNMNMLFKRRDFDPKIKYNAYKLFKKMGKI